MNKMAIKKPAFQKSKAVFEVITVFILIFLVLRAFRLSSVATWQSESLKFPFVEYTIIILVTLLILSLIRGDKGVYGVTFHKLGYHLDVAVACLIIVIPLSALKYGFLFPKFQISYLNWDGALISSLISILSIICILFLIKNKPSYSILPPSSPGTYILLLFFTFVMVLLTIPFTHRVAGFVFYLFFMGSGEEIFFRGYIQSRLNLVFGRPYQFAGIPWGWGLIIASLLFGFMHYVNPHNPYQVWWVFWTFFSGLMYGIIREKTGGIVAPAIAHGMPQALAMLFFGAGQ
jgi:uncharacterized protein